MDAWWTLGTMNRFDYCNAVLYGATMQVMQRLQMVMNAAAHIVTGWAVASISISHQCSVISYADHQCLSKYRLKLHSLHLTVSKVPVQHILSTPAYWRQISLAEPVSILQNVDIWLCWEQKQQTKFKCCHSSHLQQYSGILVIILYL